MHSGLCVYFVDYCFPYCALLACVGCKRLVNTFSHYSTLHQELLFTLCHLFYFAFLNTKTTYTKEEILEKSSLSLSLRTPRTHVCTHTHTRTCPHLPSASADKFLKVLLILRSMSQRTSGSCGRSLTGR